MLVLPTAYLPSVSYFQLLAQNNSIQIELYERFPKQTLRNRTYIASSQGALRLSVPLAERSNNSLTKDIKICYKENWQLKHWRAIEAGYNSSPYFEYFKDDFKEVFFKKEENLIDKNLNLIQFFLNLLKINSSISYTDALAKPIQTPVLKPPAEKYYQVFSHKLGFLKDLSILDLSFNEGKNSITFLHKGTEI